MFKKITALIIIIIILPIVYFIYDYLFIKPAEAPIIKMEVQSNEPATAPASQTDAVKPTNGFRGPTGMPFIKGPTEPPPGQ